MTRPLALVTLALCFAAVSATSQDLAVTYDNVTSSALPPGLGGSSMDARPADLDGDGDLDLVVACEFCENILLLNDGHGVFSNQSQRLPSPSRDSEDVGAADFDGDGDLDLVFVSEDDRFNELYLNDGGAVFSDASDRLPVSGTSNAVLTVDIDRDGDIDILIGNQGPNSLLLNDGAGAFTDASTERFPVSTRTTQDLEWGDVDGDGDEDLMVANENGNELWLNDGAGFFTDATADRLPLPTAGEETREADLGDVDDDGDLDLFLANVDFTQNRPAQNRLLLNDGSGFFSDVTAAALPVAAHHTVDGDFVDLDRDGDLDLVLAQAFNGTFQALINDGGGVFSDRTGDVFTSRPTGSGIDVEAADYDGDGLLDLYLCRFQTSDLLYRGRSRLNLRTNPAPRVLILE